MSLPKKIIAALALVAVASGGVWIAVTQPWKRPPPVAASEISAKLELAAGEVLLEPAQGSEGSAQRLLSGTPLPQGATLRTGEGARALVRLQDGARVYLDAQTRVSLAEGLVLHEGRAWLDVPGLDAGREPAEHRVGEATVALSEGGASLELHDGQAHVYVAEGLAVVSGPGGRQEVAAGEQAVLAGSAAPEVTPVAFWDDWTGGMGDRSGLGASFGAGSGSLYAVDRSAPPGSPALPLQIQSQSVQVVMRGDVAETRVDQRFFNPSGRDVEGYYWFTVPEGSQLVSFALETNGQLVEAEVVERKQAAATYEAAVQRANDPALLEWVDERTVRARIFPVPALGTRRTVVRYQQLLTEAEGKLRYAYPLAAPAGKQTASIEDFSLAVDLGELGERYDIATLGEARVEDAGRRVTMRRSGYTPRADFQLELTRKPGKERAPLRLSMLDPGGDQARYVMVRYAPDLDFGQVTMPRGEVVVVVDTSAAGDPSEYQTRLAVTEALLRSLSEGDRFAVMSADVKAEALYPATGLAEAGPQAVSEALEQLAAHGTGGATDLGAIFELALSQVHGLEQPAVIYVGDGMATSGERGGDALAERLRRSLTGSSARLFTVGVGQEVDDRLLQTLARVGGGGSVRVEGPEQAIVRALELSGALKTPTVTALQLDLGEGLDDVFWSTTGKLSRGQELVVLARTHHDLPKEITVSGRLGGEPFERTYEPVREQGVLEQLVPRLWAGAYVERLLGDSRGPEAVRGKVLSLGLEYGLMTPYTSFIALDSEQAYAAMGIVRRSRRFGGVRLTADAAHLQQRSTKRDRGALEIVGAILSAPIGCDASDSSHEEPAMVAAPPPVQSSPASDAPARAVSQSFDAAKADRAMAPEDDAAYGRPVEAEPAALEEAPPAAPPSAVSKPKIALGGGGDPLDGLVGGAAGDDGGGFQDGEPSGPGGLVEGESGGRASGVRRKGGLAKLDESRNEEDRHWRSPVVTSTVVRGRQLPCSDASARRLAQRRVLWEQRLMRLSTMTESLEVYEASAGGCEVGSWRDQRAFLELLQARARTEADVALVLAHFGDEPDAARYLARALLRRLVDPSMVAAVHNALFGALVDWDEVDARVVLAESVDDKLGIVRDALLRSPGDPQGELRLIELLVVADRVSEAVTHGTRLREQGMMTPELAQSLGEVMVAHGQTEQAQRLFSEIVEFDPSSPQSRRLLGDIFLRHGWYDGAYRQYEDLVALSSTDPTAAIRLARAAAGTGRVDEALRTLRKLASGEGRPGADDPRRFARLHAAALLAVLLRDAAGSSEIPADGVSRELRRLQLFEGPGSWTLLVWKDLEARLVLTHEDPTSRQHVGDPLIAGDTGLFALQAPPGGLPPLTVRHAGEVLDRPVSFTRITLTFDGKGFTVDLREGELPAGRSRLVAEPPSPEEDEDTVTDDPAEVIAP
ncbi:VIT domain-containing protein [Paraliomyxa miuraensis]|uniref:VIT domain-containing protein n=1 Tax=Paraliomyxa miuraensis TaxID=376150 RepID=UPI0022577294|nr:VIT domain-containing protein [Paraliomyxa miuraensis]MCX4245882.1 VIT domain-containing protein [Paraliomyxa miuraensis]